MTSAVRVGGERLYKKAHRGESVETPVREDFVRSTGSGGAVGWAWEFAEGEEVSVSVSRVTSANGWMVAPNRCSF